MQARSKDTNESTRSLPLRDFHQPSSVEWIIPRQFRVLHLRKCKPNARHMNARLHLYYFDKFCLQLHGLETTSCERHHAPLDSIATLLGWVKRTLCRKTRDQARARFSGQRLYYPTGHSMGVDFACTSRNIPRVFCAFS